MSGVNRRLPPLYALRAFEAAARLGSFTRAGQELALTQSAVSRHVRTLEGVFGCRLFERAGRHLVLTDAGRHLLPGLSEGFDALAQACATLAVEEHGLRLKAPTTLSLRWLLPRLARFRQGHPEWDVQLTSVWMTCDHVDFLHEPFDCAVLLSDGDFLPEWEVMPLFSEWLIPVCAPAAAGDRPWDLARLRREELLHPTPDRRDWRRWLQRLGLQNELSLKGGQVFDTLELGMVAAARGYGVSIGDLVMVADDVAAGLIALPWPDAVASGQGYYLVWPRERRSQTRFERLGSFLRDDLDRQVLPQVRRHK